MATEPRYPAIVAELLAMRQADQDMRDADTEGREPWAADQDRRRTTRLKEIIQEIGGWPTVSKVGGDASSAAWLIAQHSDLDVQFMKDCLARMKQAKKGDVRPGDIAYLEDRIAIREKRLQTYGTQVRGVGSESEPYPIKDPADVDQRRAAIGLGPLAEYLARFRNEA